MSENELKQLAEIVATDSRLSKQGVSFHFDEGDDTPYRISSSKASESFASFEELLEAAELWKQRVVV